MQEIGARNRSIPLKSHMSDATFSEGMTGNGFNYFEIRPTKGLPVGPGEGRPPQRGWAGGGVRGHGLRKSKRNACSGNCKTGISLSNGICFGVRGPIQPRLSNQVPDGAASAYVTLAPFAAFQPSLGKGRPCSWVPLRSRLTKNNPKDRKFQPT